MRGTAGAVLILAAAPETVVAQPSTLCQYTTVAYISVGLELQEARSAYTRCMAARSGGCASEQQRVLEASRQLRMLRDYLTTYCAR